MVNVSVATACYNSAWHIRSTFDSIRRQTRRPFEYLVIDGGSTDGTVEIINEYKDIISYWQSAKDGGIADAMNQAVAHANGEYILFLHSDDCLAGPDSLRRAAEFMAAVPGRDIYVFSVLFGSDANLRLLRARGFGWRIWFKPFFPHQGIICRRELFRKLGLFDTSFRICMDYEWFYRAHRNGASLAISPEVLSVMSDGGISSRRDRAAVAERLGEERRVHALNARGMKKLMYRLYWAAYARYRGLHVPPEERPA